MIVFQNNGEIDPQLITLIGVNVKDNPSAIGYFGTGLKYAIASLTRWDESITIRSGLNEFTFSVEKTYIRGKEFGVITMHSKFDHMTLGYTTDLGKNWKPWMVYRELWCNAWDESGTFIYETDELPTAKPGLTQVIVAGPQITTAHYAQEEFILPKKTPFQKLPNVELYNTPGNNIFYRGIAVQGLEKPSLYTYNITQQLNLTEDRTASSWATDPIITRDLASMQDPALIKAILTASEKSYESKLDYCYVYGPSATWQEVAKELVAKAPLSVSASVRSKFIQSDKEQVCPTCKRPL